MGSLGYAEKLSVRADVGGQLGARELSETQEALKQKLDQLATLVAHSNKIIAFTGAGISTSCGIPDFRGPNGIWTLQHAGKPIPKCRTTFATAKPSYTHQALVALLGTGKLQYICSQNVDGLHLRSGVPPAQLAELHGNCFVERCPKCKTEYVRDFEMARVGFKATGRSCSLPGCRGRLKDVVLDWEDALPEDKLEETERIAGEADLAICLGTSLQITPACDLPDATAKAGLPTCKLLVRTARAGELTMAWDVAAAGLQLADATIMAGGKVVIVNLQQTPKDKKAHLVIHAKADDVMRHVMTSLGLPVPPYRRTDTLMVSHDSTAPSGRGKAAPKQALTLTVASRHGPGAPMPFVVSAEVSFEGQEDVRPASLRKPPFTVRRSVAGAALRACIRLQLDESLDPEVHSLAIDYDIDGPSGCREITFTSQQQTYDDSGAGGRSGSAALQAAEGNDSSQGALLALKFETLDRGGSKEEPDAKRQRTSGSLIQGLPQAKPG